MLKKIIKFFSDRKIKRVTPTVVDSSLSPTKTSRKKLYTLSFPRFSEIDRVIYEYEHRVSRYKDLVIVGCDLRFYNNTHLYPVVYREGEQVKGIILLDELYATRDKDRTLQLQKEGIIFMTYSC